MVVGGRKKFFPTDFPARNKRVYRADIVGASSLYGNMDFSEISNAIQAFQRKLTDLFLLSYPEGNLFRDDISSRKLENLEA